MRSPRILIGAGASGSGKTLITCGILQALTNRGLKVSSFKCGPDYIDPMFHRQIIGSKASNLDSFFCEEEILKYLFLKQSRDTDISVMEGVMGYYDGLGGISTAASSYDVARITKTPTVLVVNCRGMSLSIAAHVKGFLEFREDSRISGVILNQVSEMLYPVLKKSIEDELKLPVYGFVPKVSDCLIESRHLGLVMPHEIEDMKGRLMRLAEILEKTLDLDELIQLAETAEELNAEEPNILRISEAPVIAVAKDEAFCFLYEENLQLLMEMGAKIAYFSPLRDKKLPEGASGLILCGGYPELFGKELSENLEMLEEIRTQIHQGLPCMAECGGFLYLHETMEDMDEKVWPMAGLIKGKAYRTKKLGRFGYITLEAIKDQLLGRELGSVKGHEFHYFDSTLNGDTFHGKKPVGKREWDCMIGEGSLLAGFPHLYYWSNVKVPYRFLEKCVAYKGEET